MNISHYSSNVYDKHKNYMRPVITFKASDKQVGVPDISTIPEDEIIKYLNSVKDYTVKNANGDTLLHELCRVNYFSPIKFLLTNPSRARSIVNIQNNKGQTPLDLAVEPKIRKLMISKNAKSGRELPSETVQTVSARVQVQKPDLMNVFKKKTPEVNNQPILQETASADTSEKIESSVIRYEEEKLPDRTLMVEKIPEKTNVETHAVDVKKDFPQELSKFTKLRFLQGDPKGLNDIIGLESIKDELEKSIIKPLKEASTANLLGNNGINIPNGILIVAPAGNGRTYLTKALSAETNLPVVELNDPQNLALIVDTIDKMYNNKNQRAILFIRGLENFVGNEHCSSKQNVNNFVRNLSNAAKSGILIIATSQDKKNINPSLLVPGIIDKVFRISVPDENMRNSLIADYFKNRPVFDDLNNTETISEIAKNTAGFSVAQIQHVINESARGAASENKSVVTLEELLDSINTYSKEQDIPEINEYNKTSMYDTVIKREQYRKGDPQSLADVGGMQDVKARITEKIIEPWKHKDEMEQYGIGMPDGVLFYGPPGSGKTYIVKGIAQELKLPLYTLPLSKVASSFRHETSKKIKEITTQLKEKYDETGEASILFLDELDSLGKSKDDMNGGADTDEINTLLQELDNAGDKGIIVIAATNKLDKIEGALARDGRLGERVYVGYADYDSRVDMLKKILGSKPVTESYANNNEFIKKLAEQFEDMPSGSIAKVLKEATYHMAVKKQPFEKSVDEAFNSYQEKELEDHLTRKGTKNRGNYLKLCKNSTLKYDTTYDRTYLSDNEPHNFAELGGMQDVKTQLQRHIINMWKPEVIEMFKENNIPMPGGAILSGPSGNGKTTLVRALVGEMGIPLYEMNYGDVGDSLIHATSKKERELFDQLAYKFKKTGEMSILLFDEIDKFVPQRSTLGRNAEYKKEEVSELLSMMNDASENGIILLGTTNHYDMIEDAVKNNPRRMGINIHVGYPDNESRKSIISKTLQGKPIAQKLMNEENLQEISDIFEGCTIGRMTDVLRKSIINSLIYKEDLTVDSVKKILELSKGN